MKSPNYRVTRCNTATHSEGALYVTLVSVPKLSGHAMQPCHGRLPPLSCISRFSPQTIGSRDATERFQHRKDCLRHSFSPQTIGSRDATFFSRLEPYWSLYLFQSPNYRVTRCNRSQDGSVLRTFHSFSPQTIGSRDATLQCTSVPPMKLSGFSPQTIGSRDATTAAYTQSTSMLSFSPQTIGSRDATDPYPFLMDLII